MIKLISYLTIAAALLILGLAAPAEAAVSRAFVSGHGADKPGCGPSEKPCRSFQFVHDTIVGAGGEIVVLDAADYGPITITKALSIVNDGVGTAGVQQATAGQSAIAINAGANDAVNLRGLQLDGVGVGSAGVRLNSGGKLTVVNCVARHFANDGIAILPTSFVFVSISNTIASDNGAAGIRFQPSGAGFIRGVIRQTTAANNPDAGIIVAGGNPGSVDAAIIDSVAFGNGIGFKATGRALMVIGGSLATHNGNGVFIEAGSAGFSTGDNKILLNAGGSGGGDVTGSFVIIPTR